MNTLLRLVALLALTLAPAARAHDPNETWAEVIVHTDQMEMLVTMAQLTALKLVDPSAKIAQLTPETFPQVRAKLLSEGAALFDITSVKTKLASRRVDVEVTEEGDVAFKIIYPRPAPGLLIFQAIFIKKLPEGFGGIIDASDTEGHNLGWDQLTSENISLVVMLPKPGEAPAKNDAPTKK